MDQLRSPFPGTPHRCASSGKTPGKFLWTEDMNLLLLAAGINAFFTLTDFG
jgi:hypothetical protein